MTLLSEPKPILYKKYVYELLIIISDHMTDDAPCSFGWKRKNNWFCGKSSLVLEYPHSFKGVYRREQKCAYPSWFLTATAEQQTFEQTEGWQPHYLVAQDCVEALVLTEKGNN